jgi:nucleoid-associated protein YgaU
MDVRIVRRAGESFVQQDQKIGLSLAVLLIGFAGAFCFRHEVVVPQPPLALDGAEQLDQRIEHLPVRAYTELEGVRLPRERDRQRAAPDGPLSEVVASPRADHADDDRPDDRISTFRGPPEPLRVATHSRYIRPTLNIEMEAPVSSNHRDTKRPEVSRPAAAHNPTPTQHADTHPHEELSRTRVTSPPHSPSVAGADTLPRDEGLAMPTYVVRPGDTLSGLAQRFLGSTHRYHELYEINRDVLSDPDRLPQGAVLRIPPLR